jgi:hypothetical protein
MDVKCLYYSLIFFSWDWPDDGYKISKSMSLICQKESCVLTEIHAFLVRCFFVLSLK